MAKNLIELALVWLTFFALALGETPICPYCKKPVESGRWMKVEGETYHFNHFLCANCGEPIGERPYYKRDGAFYDSSCFVSRFAQRCAWCDQPMSQWLTVNGKSYHESCYLENVAPLCAICGKPITGDYLFDPLGNKIHAEHQGELKQCIYCGRFISAESEGGEQYDDGRVVCGICLKSVVMSVKEADSLLLVARDLLNKEGIYIKPKKFDLELVSRTEMLQMSNRPRVDQSGFTDFRQSRYLGGLIKENDIKIVILSGMPRINYLGTAAHELMHVWLGLQGRFDTEDILAEGSCNYAAYLVLLKYGGEGEAVIARMLEDTDPIYGVGFRRVKGYVETVGLFGWLGYLKDFDFPPWTE